MVEVEVIDVNKNNIDTYPPRCFLKKDNPGQIQKNQWVLDRLKKGMKIKLLLSKSDKKLIGYIEYIPGKFAWRAVNAKDYMLLHVNSLYLDFTKETQRTRTWIALNQ